LSGHDFKKDDGGIAMGTQVMIKTNPLSAYGVARSTVSEAPLSPEALRKTHAYWRACNYLSLASETVDLATP
jgi:hypothetical protein